MGAAIEVFYTIVDEKGDTSRVSVHLPDTTALADVAIFVAQFGALVQAVVTGGLINAGFTVSVDLSGTWDATPSANSDVQERGEWGFRTADNFIKRMGVPTLDETKMAAGTRELDQTDSDVQNLQNAMISGLDLTGAGGSGTVYPSDIHGIDLASLAYAREAWGKRRK